VRRGPALSRATLIPWLAVLFAIPPLISLITQGESSSQVIWTLVVIAGSVPASYVVKQRGPDTLRYIFLCLATGGLVGAFLLTVHEIVGSSRTSRGRSPTFSPRARATRSPSRSRSSCCGPAIT
jgi:hypothetical protein